MSGRKEREMPEKNYCIAPWINGLLEASGKVSPCCYNPVSFGNWLDSSLVDVWHSPSAMQLRKAIANGHFINQVCATCYRENRAHSPIKLLGLPFGTYARVIAAKYPQWGPTIRDFKLLFNEKKLGASSKVILEKIATTLDSIDAEPGCDHATKLAVGKFRVLCRIMKDFLTGEVRPCSIAPMRSTFVIAVCNARCVQCPMKYSGAIQEGALNENGTRKKLVEYNQLLRALAHEEDIVNFLPLASEILLYPHWKKLALKLRDIGVKLRFSTNAMALSAESTRFLIDNALIGTITFSMDGSSKPVYENVRINLNFEKVVENIKYFFYYASKKNYAIQTGFSFVVMQRNFLDMPGFVDLVATFRRKRGGVKIGASIGVHSLQLVGPEEYLKFMEQEHHCGIDPVKLGEAFAKTQERAERQGIQVVVFNKYKINEFNEKYLKTLLSGKNPFVKKQGVCLTCDF